MVCKVCKQEIEPIWDEPGEWQHARTADLALCRDLDCLGQAVPEDGSTDDLC
jgi:hypothetical protein